VSQPVSTPPIIAPKKLIEVALPLDAINKACSRETSIRHGHPSTLHLWWARRPLAAARAVLFAQLVNDPSWKYSADELKKNQIKGAITKKRNELFKLITELVQWENTTNEQVLERARREIRASWKETCEANKNHPDAKTLFDPQTLPSFFDPFAGGGAIPLEAQRLGLEAHASDLNPVAVLINKAMIEFPPKFAGRPPVGPRPKDDKQTKAKASEDWSGAKGLAEDVRRYGAWMIEEAEKRIGHLYPKIEVTKEMGKQRADLKPHIGKKLTVIAWIWARTVKSSNPAFAHVDVPLVSSFLLGTKPGKEAYVEPVVDGDTYRFEVRLGKPPDQEAVSSGTKLSRANFRCLVSGAPITGDYIKSEGQKGRIGTKLLAVVAEGERGRIYLSPTEEIAAFAAAASPGWKPDVAISGSTQYIGVKPYGMTTFGQLFTDRQLLALNTFSDLIGDVIQACRSDAMKRNGMPVGKALDQGGVDARAYSEAVGVYLAFALSRMANYSSTLCVWSSHAKDELAKQVFMRQALSITWDFAETNPFSSAGGTLGVNIQYLSKSITGLSGQIPATAVQANATTLSVDGALVSTDPPYFDNVPYADLSDFFYVWLRRALKNVLPDLFATIAAPKADELVAFGYRHETKAKAEAFFLDGMTKALHGFSAAHPAYPSTIYYAFRQADTDEQSQTASTGWDTFLAAVLGAGLEICGTWPMRTEYTGNLKTNRNALASSIVLVCRPRHLQAKTVARKDFLRELASALPRALMEMTADPEAAVAPVDLAQAAIGPGMAIFSMYETVLEADGSPMSVHKALVHINQSIDNFFAEAEGELDADTRFCIGWFQQHGFEVGPFGEADVLARAKGTAVDGMKDAGVIDAGKGKVRLFKIKDLPKTWDPAADDRVPIWEATHQMCRALTESEAAAGALLAHMPEKQDAIRHLAYRLYTICERQKWAEEARAYNELVTSWPAIVEASQAAGLKGEQLGLI
jgi:putative DNA methylase